MRGSLVTPGLAICPDVAFQEACNDTLIEFQMVQKCRAQMREEMLVFVGLSFSSAGDTLVVVISFMAILIRSRRLYRHDG